MIRIATIKDAGDIAGIYNDYIAHTVITFEEQEVTASQMARRISEVLSSSLPWLVADRSGQVVGYAYASQWKVRSAYRFSVETAVYIHRNHLGEGLGS
jgi:L-amino acid N-acyltransferase YncA